MIAVFERGEWCFEAHFSNLSMSDGNRPSQYMEETVRVGASNAIDWKQSIVTIFSSFLKF